MKQVVILWGIRYYYHHAHNYFSSVPILSSTQVFSLSVNLLHCPSSRSQSIIFSTRIRLSRFTSNVITVSFHSTRLIIRVREPLSFSSIRTHFLILSSASSSIFPYTSTTYSFSCSYRGCMR